MYPRIHDLREDKDLTQKQIGELLNMSQTGYNQYDIGKNDIPTKVLMQLAEFYNTNIDYFTKFNQRNKAHLHKNIKKVIKKWPYMLHQLILFNF